MNVGFAGTPAFAAKILAALLEAGFAVPLVLTQPDRPKGRGLNVEPSPVKRLAMDRGLTIFQPATLASKAARAPLLAAKIDVLAVAAYGLMLPHAMLAWPRCGCLNVHASLLPRWRGAAPIQRALLAGDAETGATIMQMDAGLDTGPILDAVRVPIGPRDTAGMLEHKLVASGARALVAVLRRIAAGEPVRPMPQSAGGATYAANVDKAEALIDWSANAAAIDRQVRAFDPAPGANTVLRGETVKVWRAQPASISLREAPPGTVLEASGHGIVVACGEGRVRIEEVQPAGGRRMTAAAFAAGRRLVPGACFGVRGD
jgi:methionyl-tRNA formyltransferase